MSMKFLRRLWARSRRAKLSAAGSDFDLCDGIYGAFASRDNGVDVAAMGEHERVVTLVWYAGGLIGNGGFEYLFSADFRNDPGFVLTAAAHATIGAHEAYRCFQEALALFPRGAPQVDLEARRAHYEAQPKETRKAINSAFWKSKPEIERVLASYIRTTRAAIEAELACEAPA